MVPAIRMCLHMSQHLLTAVIEEHVPRQRDKTPPSKHINLRGTHENWLGRRAKSWYKSKTNLYVCERSKVIENFLQLYAFHIVAIWHYNFKAPGLRGHFSFRGGLLHRFMRVRKKSVFYENGEKEKHPINWQMWAKATTFAILPLTYKFQSNRSPTQSNRGPTQWYGSLLGERDGNCIFAFMGILCM